MPFAFTCPSCQARLKAPDEALGRVLTCPRCKGPAIVTRPLPPPPPARPAVAPDAIQAAPPAAPAPGALTSVRPASDTDVHHDPPAAGGDYEDFEVVGDADEDEEPYEDLEIEQEPRKEDDIPEVLPAGPDDVPLALPVEGVDDLEVVDELEEVGAGRRRDPFADSRLLALPRLFIKGRRGGAADLFVDSPNSYALFDPATRRRVGTAEEVQDGALTALNTVIRGSKAWATARIEVCEGRGHELLFTVRRSPHLWTSRVEVLDAYDEQLGYFNWAPFSRLLSKPFLIHDGDGRLVLKMQPQFMSGRLNFHDRAGRYLGNMMTEAAYLNRIKLTWTPRGGSYYVTFRPELDGRPRHKALLLGAALGIDLIDTEHGKMRVH